MFASDEAKALYLTDTNFLKKKKNLLTSGAFSGETIKKKKKKKREAGYAVILEMPCDMSNKS